MFGEGLNPPIKFYPMAIPSMTSGADVAGNDKKVVTEQGKTFLLTVTNLLQGAVKIFSQEEGEALFSSTIWPGLKTAAAQNNFKFIDYVGKDEDNQIDWGDLSRVDYDFNGQTDSGRTIEDSIPQSLYKEKAGDNNAVVEYDLLDDELKQRLSSSTSFWQDILGGPRLSPLFLGRTRPVSAEGCFDFLVGLTETKRRWVYGMNGIGINPNAPNAAGAVDHFDNIFQSGKMQEAGALNMQDLRTYIGAGKIVATRFGEIAANNWFKNTAFQSAKNYYASRVAGVDIDLDKANIDNFRALLGQLKVCLDNSGKLILPVKKENETDEEYQTRTTAFLGTIKSILDQMLTALNNLNGNYQSIRQGFGLILSKLPATETLLFAKVSEYAGMIPASVDGNTDFSALKVKLNKINSLVISVDNLQISLKTDPGSVLDKLFKEFSSSLSTDDLSEDLAKKVKKDFEEMLKKPIAFMVGIMGVNSVSRAVNRTSAARFRQKVDDKAIEKYNEAKSGAKHNSVQKSEENKALQASAARTKQNNKIEPKAAQAQAKNNKRR